MKLTDQELRDRRIARCRAYRLRNIERMRAYDRMRSVRDKDKRREASRSWASRNKEKMRESVRRSMRKNRHKYKAREEKWIAENREKVNRYAREYCARFPERRKLSVALSARKKPWLAAERASRRRAALKKATPPWADRAAVRAIFMACAKKTASTGIPHEVDHIYPLVNSRFSGLHVPWNLQILTGSENSRKGNRI